MKIKNIVLLTDFGKDSIYIGQMKAVLLKGKKNENIIDLTHRIEPQNIGQANFLLKKSYEYFPEYTLFLNVVDPGVGTDRKILLVKYKKKYFLAPDNGLVSFFENNAEYYFVNWKKIIKNKISDTFHGRDIFAPICNYIVKNNLNKNIFLRIPFEKIVKIKNMSAVNKNRIKTKIIFIDSFGNLITPIEESFYKNKKIEVRIGNKNIKEYIKNYASGRPGGLYLITGSFGTLEICSPFCSAVEKIKSREVILKIKE